MTRYDDEETSLRDDSGLLDEEDTTKAWRMKWGHKFTKTMCLCMAFFVLGLCIAIPGPTLMDLGQRVHADTGPMTLVFTARSVGYLLGSVLGGVLFDYFDKQLLLFCTLFVASIATVAIPWSLTLIIIAVLISLQGAAMGVLDTGGNMFCIRIWGKKSGPYMQGLHFAFGIGAFIAPLLAKPFLSNQGLLGSENNTITRGNIPVLGLNHHTSHVEATTVKGLSKRSVELKVGERLNWARIKFSSESLEFLKDRYERDVADGVTSSTPTAVLSTTIISLVSKSNSNAAVAQKDTVQNVGQISAQGNATASTVVSSVNTSLTVPMSTKTTVKPMKPTNNNDGDLGLHGDTADGHQVKDQLEKNQHGASQTVDKTVGENKGQDQVTTKKPSSGNTNIVSKTNTRVTASSVISGSNMTSSAGNVSEVKESEVDLSSKDLGGVSNTITITLPSTDKVSGVVSSKMKTSASVFLSTPNPTSNTVATSAALPKTTTVVHSTTLANKTTVTTTTSLAKTTTTTVATTTSLAKTTTKEMTTTVPKITTKTTSVLKTSTTTVKRTSTPTVKTTVAPVATSSGTVYAQSTKSTKTEQQTPKPSESKTSNKPPEITTKGTETVSPARNSSPGSLLPNSNVTNSSINPTDTPKKPEHTGNILETAIHAVKNISKIQFAYLIIGLALFVNSVIFLVLFCKDRRHFPALYCAENVEEPSNHGGFGFKLTMLVFLFMFFFCYVGMEVTYGGLVSTFAVEFNHWSKEEGAMVAAMFWGALATGRGFAIFISKCCHPSCMLFIDMGLVIFGALILCIGPYFYTPLLWLGTLFLGFGMSSVFPTGISWAESYFRLTGKATAVFVVGSALGEMIIPVTTGYLYDHFENMVLMKMILALGIISTVIFTIMQCVASKKERTSSLKHRDGFLPLKDDDDMLELEGLNYGSEEEHTTYIRGRKKKKSARRDAEYSSLINDMEDD